MTFVETSAFVALLLGDKEIDAVTKAISKSTTRITGAHVRLEVCIVVATRLAVSVAEADRRYQAVLDEAEIHVEALTDEISHLAIATFAQFGKGQKTKAQLNFGDCLSYAFAKHFGAKMLHIGDDFTHTDVRRA
jgi:ribonuclease VapC